jgi:hypothetical protein
MAGVSIPLAGENGSGRKIAILSPATSNNHPATDVFRQSSDCTIPAWRGKGRELLPSCIGISTNTHRDKRLQRARAGVLPAHEHYSILKLRRLNERLWLWLWPWLWPWPWLWLWLWL